MIPRGSLPRREAPQHSKQLIRFKLLVVLALAAIARSSLAQQVPDFPERDPKNTAVKEAVKTRADAGKSALGAKDLVQAVQHFANALWWDPFAAPVLADLVEASASSEDAQTLWAHQLAAADCGRARLATIPRARSRSLRRATRFVAKIATARAEAAAQLASA